MLCKHIKARLHKRFAEERFRNYTLRMRRVRAEVIYANIQFCKHGRRIGQNRSLPAQFNTEGDKGRVVAALCYLIQKNNDVIKVIAKLLCAYAKENMHLIG